MIRPPGCVWLKKPVLDRVNNTQMYVYSLENIGYPQVWHLDILVLYENL